MEPAAKRVFSNGLDGCRFRHCVFLQYLLQQIATSVTLDGVEQLPQSKDEDGFEYYVRDKILLNSKLYKLIWLLHEEEIFIGVVNAYRRN